MARINVEDHKKAIFTLNGIPPFEEEMTFYYDESGNCRKFSLTDAGFNNTDALKGDFVLAGVAHEGRSFDIDVPSLYAALDYKEGQKELKFKHLFHNSKDFQSFIGSKRATGFLEWLIRSGLYIHYSALNNLYYSLVDIVDSLWETHPQWLMYMWDIKGALYDFVIEHQDEVIDIFIRHTYPNVKDVSTFCNEICSLIWGYNDDSEYDPGFFLELLRQNLMVQFLGEHGFRAKKTGSNDGGIDIIATSITRPIKYSFNIQCKFFNKPLSKAPIQEVYAGTHYYNNGAAPVVITNNRVTAEARIFAKKLGVEIIADAEWTEIKQVIDSKKIANPNVHGGLMGILLAFITSDSGYLKMVSSAIQKTDLKAPSDKEQLKLELLSAFDAAEEFIRESAYYQQKAAQCSQKALSLQKQALLKNLDYG